VISPSTHPRRLEESSQVDYDLAIIGGGIIGSGVARDAAMRGLMTILFEKEDFAYGTSSRSSRLIHGGLRYLGMYDFELVREGLREREILLRIAPHLVTPLKFLIPLHHQSSLERLKLKLGMILYDLLSYDKSLPSHQYISGRKAVEMEPALEKSNLHGAFVYYDCQIALTERLCMENVISARNHGATLLNHAKVIGLQTGKSLRVITVKDELTNNTVDFRSKIVVNLTGPWLDEVVRSIRPDMKAFARTTKGIHLVTPKFTENAVAIFTSDERLFFVIPWLGFSLVGSTDTDYTADMDSVKAEEADVEYLLKELQNSFPHMGRRIFYSIAGVRSLLRVEGAKESAVTRRHVIHDHESEDLRGVISVIGGKLTAYRSIAEDVVDKVCDKLEVRTKGTTANENLPGAEIQVIETARTKSKEIASKYGISEATLKHLIELYGSRYTQVLEYVARDPSLRNALCERNLDIEAEIPHAIERESALTLSDFMLRRALIAYRECEGLDCCSAVANKMSKILGWDEEETSLQIENYRRQINLRHKYEHNSSN
jgi:glycerol-3-phosphate dehydrogenase